MNTETISDKSVPFIYSNDPAVAGLADTPKPEMCKFCGTELYTKGFSLLGEKIIWMPFDCVPCECPDGIAEYKARQEQQEAESREEEAREQRDRISKIIGNSGIGERFLQRTFDSFITDTVDRKKIAAVAKMYTESFDGLLPKRGEPLPGKNGFLITGPKGTGKTHIAAAIANELMGKGTPVICMSESKLYDRIKQTYSQKGEEESRVRKIYETVPLLIIDDLGKERATDWTLSTLYSIIDGRYERAMPLIITSNYGAVDLVSKLTPAGEDKTTADAITDRLAEMCKKLIIGGESWRTR